MRRHSDRPTPSLTLLVTLSLLLGAGGAGARSLSLPPPGTAGDPPAGTTCWQTGCHAAAATPLNSGDVTLELVNAADGTPFTQYVPGEPTPHLLSFRISSGEAGRARWGFEMTGLAGMARAGTFVNGPSTATQSPPGKEYISHAINMVGDNQPSFSWDFGWRPPATNVGDVTFYACGNAANRNFGAGGDYIECTTFLVSPAAGGDADGDTVPDASDNCVNVPNGGQANFDGDPLGDACDDSDLNGLLDELEIAQGLLPLDADADDDGLSDVEEVGGNGIRDPGETDATDPDSDGDGIQDGTEAGELVGVPDPDGAIGPATGTDAALFTPDDQDAGAFTTDPLDTDTDGDTCADGEEDLDADGFYDNPGEPGNAAVADCGIGPASLLRTWRSNATPLPSAYAACATSPCTGTSPPDLVICREAANFEEYPGATLPFEVPLTGPGGFAGRLVYMEFDSDTTAVPTLDVIDVRKDPARPGGLLVLQH